MALISSPSLHHLQVSVMMSLQLPLPFKYSTCSTYIYLTAEDQLIKVFLEKHFEST